MFYKSLLPSHYQLIVFIVYHLFHIMNLFFNLSHKKNSHSQDMQNKRILQLMVYECFRTTRILTNITTKTTDVADRMCVCNRKMYFCLSSRHFCIIRKTQQEFIGKKFNNYCNLNNFRQIGRMPKAV